MTQNTSSAVMQQRSEPHTSLDDFPTPPRRCQTDIVDHFGECFACNAISGERCQQPQKVASLGQSGGDVGRHNHAIVRAWFLAHPCATNREASEALGLSVTAIGRHVARIRAEWGGK